MLIDYIHSAMCQAHYEILPDDRSYFGEIKGLKGVYANAPTLEGCREELESTLEDWLLFRIARGLALPKIGGIKIQIKKVA